MTDALKRIRRIGVLGGGRWAHVVVNVLVETSRRMLPTQPPELIWFTNHGHQRAIQQVQKNAWSHVAVTRRGEDEYVGLDAAVVVTSPSRHTSDCLALLQAGVPTLCEKPITHTLADAQRLQLAANSQSCALGVNLPFAYADYLHDFAALVSEINIEHVAVSWHDPWSEKRHDQPKQPDIYTDYASDMLPHGWTLLRVVRPTLRLCSVRRATYAPREVHLVADYADDVTVSFSLSRRANTRIRQISINHDQYVLDFSTEPGWSRTPTSQRANRWSTPRPLSRSLADFMDVVSGNKPPTEWPVSLDQCIGSVQLAEQAARLLRHEQVKQIRDLRSTGNLDLQKAEHVALVLDTYMPEYAMQKARPLGFLFQDQQAFALAALAQHKQDEDVSRGS